MLFVGIVFALFFDFTLFGIIPAWSTFMGIGLVLLGVILNMRLKA
jgi:drug/metabolite transporter (DMT)-like permease